MLDGRQLPVMYHWAPVARRRSIERDGLVPKSRNTVASVPLEYVCLSPAPSTAWGLSGAVGWATARDWDLYEVRLGDRDEVRLRVENWIVEVKVTNLIEPERVWRVGSRRASAGQGSSG